MGSAADNVGNGSATPSELERSSLVTDGSSVTDETVLPSAAKDHTGDKTPAGPRRMVTMIQVSAGSGSSYSGRALVHLLH
jgi:hypothetical protein